MSKDQHLDLQGRGVQNDSYINYNSQGTTSHFKHIPTRVIVITKEPNLNDLIPFIFLLILYGLVIQTICIIMKKTNKKLYDTLVFVVLFLAPPIIILFNGFFLFPIMWAMFTMLISPFYFKVKKKPVDKNVPSHVFTTFKFLFTISNFCICIFQFGTILTFFFIPSYTTLLFLIFITCVYFGLLSREFVYVLSESMALNTGFYSNEGIPSRNNNSLLCMICIKTFDDKKLIHTLICSHSFHENCIKGWCMIAKKSSCPYCKKGVDLETIPKDIWYKSEVWFYPLINALRGFIVFFVSIIIIIYYKISFQ